MMKRLNKSAELAAYASQFVAVKIDERSNEWQDVDRVCEPVFNGNRIIPLMYIIRSDGTPLYGANGLKTVPEMGQILIQALGQSGRSLNEAQVRQIIKTKEEIDAFREEGDLQSAVALVRKTQKLGPPGEINSYANPAIELNAVVTELIKAGKAAIAPIQQSLTATTFSTDEEKVKFLNEYLDVCDQYEKLRPLKDQFADMKKQVKEFDGMPALQKALEAIRKAASADSKSKIERGLEKLNSIAAEIESQPILDQANEAIKTLNARLEEFGDK